MSSLLKPGPFKIISSEVQFAPEVPAIAPSTRSTNEPSLPDTSVRSSTHSETLSPNQTAPSGRTSDETTNAHTTSRNLSRRGTKTNLQTLIPANDTDSRNRGCENLYLSLICSERDGAEAELPVARGRLETAAAEALIAKEILSSPARSCKTRTRKMIDGTGASTSAPSGEHRCAESTQVGHHGSTQVGNSGSETPLDTLQSDDLAASADFLACPRRRYECPNYTTCLSLAAALNWDSFTCRGCDGSINEQLLWQAHVASRRDTIAQRICFMPKIRPVECTNATPDKGSDEV